MSTSWPWLPADTTKSTSGCRAIASLTGRFGQLGTPLTMLMFTMRAPLAAA